MEQPTGLSSQPRHGRSNAFVVFQWHICGLAFDTKTYSPKPTTLSRPLLARLQHAQNFYDFRLPFGYRCRAPTIDTITIFSLSARYWYTNTTFGPSTRSCMFSPDRR